MLAQWFGDFGGRKGVWGHYWHNTGKWATWYGLVISEPPHDIYNVMPPPFKNKGFLFQDAFYPAWYRVNGALLMYTNDIMDVSHVFQSVLMTCVCIFCSYYGYDKCTFWTSCC